AARRNGLGRDTWIHPLGGRTTLNWSACAFTVGAGWSDGVVFDTGDVFAIAMTMMARRAATAATNRRNTPNFIVMNIFVSLLESGDQTPDTSVSTSPNSGWVVERNSRSVTRSTVN
ncbi:hypothetical protein ACFQ1S_36215, partial [Kibdelosporangium lantanae]